MRQETENIALSYVEKYFHILNRLGVDQCDRQTIGQTDRIAAFSSSTVQRRGVKCKPTASMHWYVTGCCKHL